MKTISKIIVEGNILTKEPPTFKKTNKKCEFHSFISIHLGNSQSVE